MSKKPLYNIIDRKLATRKVEEEKKPRTTLSFYRYVRLENPAVLRNELYEEWDQLGVLGRIYLAEEGINAQLSVPKEQWDDFIETLERRSVFQAMPLKIALEEKAISFIKLTIKVRTQIVADGLTSDDYDISNVGTPLDPEAFHELMEAEDAIVVDMRNHYESEIGRFDGAICPDVDTFREELPMVRDLLKGKEDNKVLLYCTGGIRCEKASAYLKHEGFKNVYQLEGGIIRYAEQMEAVGLKSKFKGKNFVFDERRAEQVTDDILANCHGCGDPCDTHVNCANEMCNLLFIQCTDCATSLGGTCSAACHDIVNLPDEERRALRKQSPVSTFNRYKKSLRPSLGGQKTVAK